VSADSIVPGAGKPQALNRYAYTFNNPLKYTDPTGHVAKDDDIMAGDEDSPAWVYGIYDEQTKNRALHAWFNSHPDYNPATDSMSFAERQGWNPDGTRAMIMMDYGAWQMDRTSKGKVDFEVAATYLGASAVLMAANFGGVETSPGASGDAGGSKGPRMRHYTSKSNAKSIQSQQVIHASERQWESGCVFCESTNRRALSPRDAEQRYLLERGRGRAYIEFDTAPGEALAVTNPRTGTTEWVIHGDVHLGGRNATFTYR
jgi:hypothetical protein